MDSKLQTLPIEILQNVLLQVPSRVDYISLRSTCQKCYNATLDGSFKARRLPVDIADVVQQHRERIIQHYPRMLENTRARGWNWDQQVTALYGRLGWRQRLASRSVHLDPDLPAALNFVDGTRHPVDSQRRKNHLVGLRRSLARSQRIAAKQVAALPADYEELLSQTNGLECCPTYDRDSSPCDLLVHGVGRKSNGYGFSVRNQVLTTGPMPDPNGPTFVRVTVPFPVKYAFQLGEGWYAYFMVRPVWITVYAYCQVDAQANFAWKVIHFVRYKAEHKNPLNLFVMFDNLVDFLTAMLRENLMSAQEWEAEHLEMIPYDFGWNNKIYRAPEWT